MNNKWLHLFECFCNLHTDVSAGKKRVRFCSFRKHVYFFTVRVAVNSPTTGNKNLGHRVGTYYFQTISLLQCLWYLLLSIIFFVCTNVHNDCCPRRITKSTAGSSVHSQRALLFRWPRFAYRSLWRGNTTTTMIIIILLASPNTNRVDNVVLPEITFRLSVTRLNNFINNQTWAWWV